MAARHFLTLNDMTTAELEDLLDHASKLRKEWRSGQTRDTLKNRVLARYGKTLELSDVG